jgi:hypothetical protein
MTVRAALALLALALPTACGASINALYEGDVRFEHCMALDSQTEVKPTIRRACWEEWTKFYTFGQTRDRVDYAKTRVKQLSIASDFDEGEWIPSEPRPPSAAPEPTSAIAPPPSLIATDGGPSDAGTAFFDAPTDALDAHAPPGADCGNECEKTWADCRATCDATTCERACSGTYKRCMRKCF